MPISEDEWKIGSTDAASHLPALTPVGEHETEKDLIIAFLSENVDTAFTRAEILRGVDFGNDARPETVADVLTEIQDELVDLAGDVVASGMLVDDLDEALDELVSENLVVEKTVETESGPTRFYRLNTSGPDV